METRAYMWIPRCSFLTKSSHLYIVTYHELNERAVAMTKKENSIALVDSTFKTKDPKNSLITMTACCTSRTAYNLIIVCIRRPCVSSVSPVLVWPMKRLLGLGKLGNGKLHSQDRHPSQLKVNELWKPILNSSTSDQPAAANPPEAEHEQPPLPAVDPFPKVLCTPSVATAATAPVAVRRSHKSRCKLSLLPILI